MASMSDADAVGGLRLVLDVVRETSGTLSGVLRSPRDAAATYRAMQEAGRIPREREAFVLFALDARHQVTAVSVISIGTLQNAPVHPREVFRPAIALGAAAIIVAHHHPSGDPQPSDDDRLVTERLRKVGECVGIEVLDHVVIGADSFWSLAEDLERTLDGGARMQRRAR